ncbi:unnamed protein product [Plutella xylostella]|uniref:Nucleoporin NUP42 n=1 Tax=Plutella xylostella TaxID=51655 RepID=A0A8S4G5N3_PLUXY|nr:unnamed protein product [Plutella xylostella]
MVVCKFFQQGSCRYGQSCRFEHVYSSKYSYQAGAGGGGGGGGGAGGAEAVSDEQLAAQAAADARAALRGGQWLLSAYAPFKEKANLPGLRDVSPEEARLAVYEARANNTLDQTITQFNNLLQEAKSKHEQLLQPSPSLVSTLRSLYRGEPVAAPFANTQNNSTASSLFRSAAQSNSVFGQSSASAFATPTENVAAKSIFAQANQNVFGGTQQQSNPSSIFASASQQLFGPPAPTPTFGQQNPSFGAAQSANIFQKQEAPSQSVFGQNNSVFNQQNSNNTFAQNPSNVFAQANANSFFGQQPPAAAPSVFGSAAAGAAAGAYSAADELAAEELASFSAAEFTLGLIPERAPPRELCV